MYFSKAVWERHRLCDILFKLPVSAAFHTCIHLYRRVLFPKANLVCGWHPWITLPGANKTLGKCPLESLMRYAISLMWSGLIANKDMKIIVNKALLVFPWPSVCFACLGWYGSRYGYICLCFVLVSKKCPKSAWAMRLHLDSVYIPIKCAKLILIPAAFQGHAVD